MKFLSIQKSFQTSTERSYGPRADEYLKKEGFDEAAIATGKKLGLSFGQMRLIASGEEVTSGETIISKSNLSSPGFQSEIAANYDRRTIDSNESTALRKAENLGLFNPSVAASLYIQAIQGTIDPRIKDEIERVQTALKADGKYDNEIDGEWGTDSRQALKDLVLENAEALILNSSQLDIDQRVEDSQNHNKGFRNR